MVLHDQFVSGYFYTLVEFVPGLHPKNVHIFWSITAIYIILNSFISNTLHIVLHLMEFPIYKIKDKIHFTIN